MEIEAIDLDVGVGALKHFGGWDNDRNMWFRTYGPFQVFEDPSEAGLNGEYILWPSSLMLAKFLESLSEPPVSGSSLLEVGAGCGVVSLASLRLGATTVTATEQRSMVPHLRLTTERNAAAIAECSGRMRVRALEWGSPDDAEHASGKEAAPDLVVGSDATYNPKLHALLARTLLDVCDEHTCVILAHDDTATPLCSQRRIEFFERLAPASFEVTELDTKEWGSEHPSFFVPTVHLFTLRKRPTKPVAAGSEEKGGANDVS